MKKITIILSAFAMSMAISSCSLDEISYTKVSADTYLEDAAQAENVLLGIYKQMGVDGIYGLDLIEFDLPNDQAKVEGSSITGGRALCSNAYTPTEASIETTWKALYTGIYYANDFQESLLDRMGAFSDSDKALCEVYLAEAKVLKALFYFELVRWYGNVPLMTRTEQSSQLATTFVQEDPVNVYRYIEQNLKEAIDVLPYYSEDVVRRDNSFRISKGGALGLLAKVYATWAGYPLLDNSKWQLAADAAGEVVNSGVHSLTPEYVTLWKNACNNVWNPAESLIEVSYYSPTSTVTTSGRIGKWNGVTSAVGATLSGMNLSLYKVHPTFLMNWKDREKDLRWDLSFADYKYTVADGRIKCVTSKIAGVAGCEISFDMSLDDSHPDWTIDWRKYYNYSLSPKKWDLALYGSDSNQIVDNNYSNANWYVLRYADVLLLYAEALNEVNNGPTPAAYEAVNAVRRRGFGLDSAEPSAEADLAQIMSYEGFRQAVRDERGYELAFECHRRQDLVRWGIYYEAIQKTYEELPSYHEMGCDYFLGALYTIKGKNELLPIPQGEVDLCGFKQNPKW